MAEVKETNPAVADSSHKDHEADATTGNATVVTKPEDKASKAAQEKAFQSYENRSDIESRESIQGRYFAAPGEYSVRAKENGDTVPSDASAKEVEAKDNVKRDN